MLLTPQIYESYIQGSILQGITGANSPVLLAQCEAAARVELSSYLNQRYDLTNVLKDLVLYSPTTTYAVGDLIYDAILPDIYEAVNIAPAGTSLTDTFYFRAGDPRNALIIQYLVEIVLFNIHKRISPQNVPAIREIAYDNAIRWLIGVQRGNITPKLPSLNNSSGNIGGGIEWGQSAPKANNYW